MSKTNVIATNDTKGSHQKRSQSWDIAPTSADPSPNLGHLYGPKKNIALLKSTDFKRGSYCPNFDPITKTKKIMNFSFFYLKSRNFTPTITNN
jgi:hypothetical protein